jgi:hypothetical protein
MVSDGSAGLILPSRVREGRPAADRPPADGVPGDAPDEVIARTGCRARRHSITCASGSRRSSASGHRSKPAPTTRTSRTSSPTVTRLERPDRARALVTAPGEATTWQPIPSTAISPLHSGARIDQRSRTSTAARFEPVLARFAPRSCGATVDRFREVSPILAPPRTRCDRGFSSGARPQRRVTAIRAISIRGALKQIRTPMWPRVSRSRTAAGSRARSGHPAREATRLSRASLQLVETVRMPIARSCT